MSSWLKAPPISSLGLTIPLNKFVMAVRSWLGVSSFPSHSTLFCSCGCLIIPNGHVLSCGHGPWRIHRHDCLRDVNYQALVIDNSSVRKYQKFSGHLAEKPGDIFHSDFSDGRPSYFDVSVCKSIVINQLV